MVVSIKKRNHSKSKTNAKSKSKSKSRKNKTRKMRGGANYQPKNIGGVAPPRNLRFVPGTSTPNWRNRTPVHQSKIIKKATTSGPSWSTMQPTSGPRTPVRVVTKPTMVGNNYFVNPRSSYS